MTPILYLDVDGVLNPEKPFKNRTFNDFRRWTVGHQGSVFKIDTSNEMCARLLALPVEIKWLTTWGNLANLELAPQVGFPFFEVAAEPPFRDKTAWWKLAHLQSVVAAGNHPPFIWIDDQIHEYAKFASGWNRPGYRTVVSGYEVDMEDDFQPEYPEDNPKKWAREIATPNLLVVPNHTTGLVDSDFERIEEFLTSDLVGAYS